MKTKQLHNQSPTLSCSSTSKDGTFSIAALTSKLSESKNNDTSYGVLTFALSEINQSDTSRVHILPDGEFRARDGRPRNVQSGHWLMDDEAYAILRAYVDSRVNDFHFDYEHQTLHADENGKPAPAAGWFKDIEYIPGEGLFAVGINWNEQAKKFIDNKEYRYASLVFGYSKVTGRPLTIQHVALTNAPALDGMKAIAALKSRLEHSTTPQQEEIIMNEALKLLLTALGISFDDADFADAAALKTVQGKATVAIAALKAKAAKSEGLETDLNTAQASVVALKAKTEVDLSQYVPASLYEERVLEIAALKTDGVANSVEQLLKDNADKVIESEVKYLTDFGKQQGFAALKAMIEERPVIAALKTTQTDGKKKPDDKKPGELTTEQLAVCKTMGVTAEAFKKQLAKSEES